jgi:very-short-patch-repair endonuclease
MLAIEIDGDTHGAQQKYDEKRTKFLESKGYRVLRFTNEDVGANLYGVLTVIADALRSPLSPALSPEGAREKQGALFPLGRRVRERGAV